MNCPVCGGTNFKQIGNSVYCVSRINGRLCGITLDKDLRSLFFQNENKKKNRKLYHRNYYYSKRKKVREAALISEVAFIKGCSRETIYYNIGKFDLVDNSSPLLIVLNEKLFNWNPKK